MACLLALKSALYVYATQYTDCHEGILHTIHMLHSTYIQASSSLLSRREGRLEQTAIFVLETAFPRRTLPQREERKPAWA